MGRMKLPRRRPKTEVQGRLTDSLDVAIERAAKLPNPEINVPLMEAVRDGRLTPAEADARRTKELAAKARA